MKKLTFPLILLALAGCATPTGRTITVENARVLECQQQGGCDLYTRAEMLGLMHAAHDLGAASVALDSQGCKRGAL